MLICFISDTHMQLDKIKVPAGDVLIHCGDALSYGRPREFREFAHQLGKLAAKFELVLYTPGNHDESVQFHLGPPMARQILAGESPKIEMLLHESYKFEWMGETVTFFGSPWTPKFGNYAYQYPKDGAGQALWEDIPPDTDVVFTHGQPYGILDRVWRTFPGEDDDHAGCPYLKERLLAVKPKVYAGGHLHMQGGQYVKIEETLFLNCAICDDNYEPTRSPIIIDTKTWDIAK